MKTTILLVFIRNFHFQKGCKGYIVAVPAVGNYVSPIYLAPHRSQGCSGGPQIYQHLFAIFSGKVQSYFHDSFILIIFTINRKLGDNREK